MQKQKGISTLIGIIIIVAIAIIAFGGVFAYQSFVVKPQPVVQTQQNQNNQTAGWKTYTNNGIGIQFKYPGYGETENTTAIDKQIGPIYVKAFSIDTWGKYIPRADAGPGPDISDLQKQKNEEYYNDIFLSIKNYSQNQNCDNLNIYIPMFGISNLGQSCRIMISDSGVKMITGFYKNIYGEPPMVAFFSTDKYLVELLLYYYNAEPTSFDLNSNSFVQEIQSNKYKNISSQIDVFNQILKTVEVTK